MSVNADIAMFRTYSRIKEDGTKETWNEVCDRYEKQLIRKYPYFEKRIKDSTQYIRDKKVLPSMRFLQFADCGIDRENLRGYNCFAQETEFITENGINKFSDFQDGNVVTVLSDKGTWRKATVKNFGKAQLLKLTIQKGKVFEDVYVTANHRWITVAHYKGGAHRVEKTTNELAVGDFLAQVTKTFNARLCPIAIQHGMVYGDGTAFDGATRITLCGDSVQFNNLFTAGVHLHAGANGGPIRDDRHIVTNLPWNWKNLPDPQANKDYLMGFLAGWFGADGSVGKTGTMSLDCKDEKALLWAKSAFARCGIVTGKISLLREISPFDGSAKPLYRMFLSNIGLTKEFFLKDSHKERFSETSRTMRWKVSKVEQTSRYEDVWCVQEPETESFCLANFVLTKNCSFLNITQFKDFADILYVSACGTGVGFSCKKRHISRLPKISEGFSKEYTILDSKEGWADSILFLMKNPKLQFDYSLIRPSGSILSTGGTASGHEALKTAHEQIRTVLLAAKGRKLRSIEVHKIVTYIADCIVVGGVRRSALISLGDADDIEFAIAKSGNWWETNPSFARANNSVHLHYQGTKRSTFDAVMDACFNSYSGEPGVVWTNDWDYGTNPCVPGETEILTNNGYVRIDSLVGQSVDVWNGFEWSTVIPQITGYNQPMVKVTLSDGRFLRCTTSHKWVTVEGYNTRQKQSRVRADNLKLGMKLLKHEYPVLESGVSEPNAYTQGFISAEGMDGYDMCWVYEPKYMCIPRLDAQVCGNEYKSHTGIGRQCVKLKSEMQSKDFVPFSWDLTSRLEWLAGLFDGDGTELIEGGAQVCSINKLFLLEVQKMLTTCGISSKVVNGNKSGFKEMPNGKGGKKEYFCQDSFRLCVGATQIQFLKKLGLKCSRLEFNKSPNRDASQFVKIVGIESDGIEDIVYCFTEEKRNLGCFEGIVTGQCGEIALQSHGLCNLTEVNFATVIDANDFIERIECATFLGTLQAGFTDFKYVSSKWKKNAKDDALLGVSLTGLAQNWNKFIELVDDDYVKYGAKRLIGLNRRFSNIIGIKRAKRITTVKPSGTSSCVLDTTSGIHAAHSPYYLRRIQMDKTDPVAIYLQSILKDTPFIESISESRCATCIPMSMENSVMRTDETAIDQLERMKLVYEHWIQPSHVEGPNTHNVSITVTYKEHEREDVKNWMWKNRQSYKGISLLPFDGGNYQHAPYETITKETFDRLNVELRKFLPQLDLSKVVYTDKVDKRSGEIACAGGSCEIK